MQITPLPILATILAISTCWHATTYGEPPSRELLEGLLERGYFDQALEFLKRAEADPDTPAEFRRTIEFERGVTLVRAARVQVDLMRREGQLNEAEGAFRAFIQKQKNHSLLFSARNHLGNILVERARMMVARAKRKTTTDEDREKLLAQARENYLGAREIFEDSRRLLKEKLTAIRRNLDPNNPDDRKLIRIRDRYRADYLQALLLIPAVTEELADTYPRAPMQREDLLMQAAKGYEEVYRDYRTRIAGLYAKMYQGRCYAKAGKLDDALTHYDDLLKNPNQPDAFLQIKQRVLTLAVNCWIGDGRSQHEEAIRQITPVLQSVKKFQQNQPEWLYLRLAVAKAYKAQIDEVAKKADPFAEEKQTARKALAEARKHADFVRQHPSEYRIEAEALHRQLSTGKNSANEPEP